MASHWIASRALTFSNRPAEMEIRNGPVAAGHARSALSGFFAWAISKGLCDLNPVIGTAKPPARPPRERALSGDEIRAVWLACGDDDFGKIIKLAIFQRAMGVTCSLGAEPVRLPDFPGRKGHWTSELPTLGGPASTVAYSRFATNLSDNHGK